MLLIENVAGAIHKRNASLQHMPSADASTRFWRTHFWSFWRTKLSVTCMCLYIVLDSNHPDVHGLCMGWAKRTVLTI